MASERYHPAAKALHWTTAIAVFLLLGVGFWMTGLPVSAFKLKLQVYNWHKWIGLVVLVLTLARLWWRWRHPPPPLPGTLAAWERRLAPLGHALLLALLIAMPISGWAMSSAAGVPVVWFGVIPLPDLIPRDQSSFETVRAVHKVLSRLLVVTIFGHLAAIVRHDVFRRDGILRRMLPTSRTG
ncbi:MAG: cytochrome b [Alphaproteobacteria bacterium]|nr:cytochrome b [Alphaproteobacteria bacterium]